MAVLHSPAEAGHIFLAHSPVVLEELLSRVGVPRPPQSLRVLGDILNQGLNKIKKLGKKANTK